jgi:REP element-mobilizing transposase RayT
MTQRRIYQEEYPYFVTFRTREGYALFEDEKMTELLSEIMFKAGRLKRYDILAYQIMPDHIHLLVNHFNTDADGTRNPIAGAETRDVGMYKRYPSSRRTRVSLPAVASTNSHPPAMDNPNMPAMTRSSPTISDLMYTIKSYFIKQIRTDYDVPYSVWHTRFYARIANNRRYLRTIIEYIKHNPIKAELSEKYRKPPYQYFDYKKINNLF